MGTVLIKTLTTKTTIHLFKISPLHIIYPMMHSLIRNLNLPTIQLIHLPLNLNTHMAKYINKGIIIMGKMGKMDKMDKMDKIDRTREIRKDNKMG